MGNSGFTRREFLRGGGLAFGAGLAVALGAGCGGFSGAQGGGSVTLKAGHNNTPDYPHGQIIQHFADLVSKKTNGEVKVDVFANATLGDEEEVVEAMRAGSVDMGKSITSIVALTVPQFAVFDLPYLFRDKAHQFKVLRGPIGQDMMKRLEGKGLKGLFWMDQGARSFYTRETPVRELADLQGLKIRAIEAPIMLDTLDAFGASPTPMDFSELYTALQQGVVDGAENSPDAVFAAKHYEVTKYFSLTEHFRTPVLFMVSLTTWNDLSEDAKTAILEASEESSRWGEDLYEKEAVRNLEEMRKEGMEIIEVDKGPFEEAAQVVYDKHAEELGTDLIDQIRSA